MKEELISSDSSVEDMYTELLTRRHSSQFQELLHDAKKVLMIVKNKHEQHLLTEERNKQLKTTNEFLRQRLQVLKDKSIEIKEQKKKEQKIREMESLDKLIKVKVQLRKLKQLYEASYIGESFQQLIDIIDIHN